MWKNLSFILLKKLASPIEDLWLSYKENIPSLLKKTLSRLFLKINNFKKFLSLIMFMSI